VQQVTLVELDPHMTRCSPAPRAGGELNAAPCDPKVKIVNADAYTWLEAAQREVFDVIVIDFPDPTNFASASSTPPASTSAADQHLAAGGYMVVQTTSPLIARRSFWTVVATLEAVGLATTPYHAHVPSFGEWGFVLAGRRPWREPTALPKDCAS
jgi:spermidine synthase